MKPCLKEDEINKLKIQNNTTIVLLTQLKQLVEKIEKTQQSYFKILLSGFISLIITLLSLILT
jgi:hypothetical protein